MEANQQAHCQIKTAIIQAVVEFERQDDIQRQRLLDCAAQLTRLGRQLEETLMHDPSVPARQALLSLLLPDEEWGLLLESGISK